MANAFDPYSEALVVETNTVWPAEFDGLSLAEKGRIGIATDGSQEFDREAVELAQSKLALRTSG